MSRETQESNRRMLRARDAMDRDFAEPLDINPAARVRPSRALPGELVDQIAS